MGRAKKKVKKAAFDSDYAKKSGCHATKENGEPCEEKPAMVNPIGGEVLCQKCYDAIKDDKRYNTFHWKKV